MNATKIITVLFVILLFAAQDINAQEKGNKKVTTEFRELPAFHSVDVGGALTAYIKIAEKQEVKVEADENLHDKISSKVKNGVLFMSSSTLKNPTKLNVYISMPEIKMINGHGASDVNLESTVKSEEFKVFASGATTIKMELDVNYLESELSGASDVKLTGKATTHILSASGASSLEAQNLETKKTVYEVSGAADANVTALEELTGEKRGAADIDVYGNPSSSVQKSGNDGSENYDAYSKNYYDSVKVKVGKVKVEVYEGDDSVRVVFGDRELKIDDEGNVRYNRCKKPKFNGHWAGFDIGLNGYLNADNSQSFPAEYEYMDLRMTKSVAAYLNFFEQNIALAKNQKWGLVTGMGLEWHNYRFSKDTRLNSDSSYLIGYIDEGVALRKSKLTTFNLAVPLLFEFQTNSKHNKNSFHIGAGMVASARLSSHTKKYYDERNKNFSLLKYNPATGEYEDARVAITSPDYSKAKNFDDFYLQPFKFDATVRIGWGFVNLFATYSINEMFKEDKGPELYPWTVGITLTNL